MCSYNYLFLQGFIMYWNCFNSPPRLWLKSPRVFCTSIVTAVVTLIDEFVVVDSDACFVDGSGTSQSLRISFNFQSSATLLMLTYSLVAYAILNSLFKVWKLKTWWQSCFELLLYLFLRNDLYLPILGSPVSFFREQEILHLVVKFIRFCLKVRYIFFFQQGYLFKS